MNKVVLAILVLVACSSSSLAQYKQGDNLVDVRIGLSSIGSALNFGADYDWTWMQANVAGPGVLTAGGSIDFTHYGYSINGVSWSENYIPIGAHVGYHLGSLMTDKKWDPFINLGAVFVFDHSASSVNSSATQSGNALYLQFIAGVKYYFSPQWHALACIGMNSSYLSVGVGYKLP